MVYRLTWEKAWKTHLWCLVFGQVYLRALAKPSPPSETTTSGAAMRDISAALARLFSYLHICQPSAFSSSEAISTTAFLPRWIPST